MNHFKLFLIGISLIFSVLMVYGAAFVVHLFTNSYLFESGMFGLDNFLLTSIMAAPLIVYTLILGGRYKLNAFKVISYSTFFTLFLFISVYFTAIYSNVYMSAKETINFSIIFTIVLVILLGAFHLEVNKTNWRMKILFICLSVIGVTSLLEIASSQLETLTDENTVAQIEQVDAPEESLLLVWSSDTMDRGNHEYDSLNHGELVVDLTYKDIKRGDVIYFKTPEYTSESANISLPEHLIGRIVGLPGETVEIKDGQVFIDEKKLNTFYSKALRNGLDEDVYFEGLTSINKTKEKAWRKYYSTSMKPVKVEEKTVFVLVDNWWRGHDSKNFGLLEIERIKGQVLGYQKRD